MFEAQLLCDCTAYNSSPIILTAHAIQSPSDIFEYIQTKEVEQRPKISSMWFKNWIIFQFYAKMTSLEWYIWQQAK